MLVPTRLDWKGFSLGGNCGGGGWRRSQKRGGRMEGKGVVVVSALQFACTDDVSTNLNTAERFLFCFSSSIFELWAYLLAYVLSSTRSKLRGLGTYLGCYNCPSFFFVFSFFLHWDFSAPELRTRVLGVEVLILEFLKFGVLVIFLLNILICAYSQLNVCTHLFSCPCVFIVSFMHFIWNFHALLSCFWTHTLSLWNCVIIYKIMDL